MAGHAGAVAVFLVFMLVSLCEAKRPNIGSFFSYCTVSSINRAPTFLPVLFSACSRSLLLVYIITDDQDIKLDSLNYQKKLQKMMTNEGLFFDNAFVTTPICCPSRFVVVLHDGACM